MKKIISVFLMLSAAALLFAKSSGKEGKDYSFNSQDLEGNKITSEIYSENKITMINIWGTFCGPCIREMPHLEKINQDNKTKGVQLIGIVIDLTDANGRIISRAKSDADYIINGTGVTYKNVVPNAAMHNSFLAGIQAVPTTIFVDKNGNQIGEVMLGSRSYKDWQKIIDKLLKEVE